MWSTATGTTVALVLFLAAIILPQASLAQPPTFVSNMAFARVGPYLYFQGGRSSQTTVSSQLVALPLNESWPASSPPWKKLADGNAAFDITAVATIDNKTFITCSPQGNTISLGMYSIQQDRWNFSSIPTPEVMGGGLRPVTEPTSGRIYVVSQNNMNAYDPQTRSWIPYPIPNNTLTQRFFGGAVYNHARYSIMYFGGYNMKGYEPQTYVTEYRISPQAWSIYNTTGDIPPTMADFCMAISEDSNTIAVFGGRFYTINRFKEPDQFSNSLYILDVPRRVWTKPLPVTLRAYTGCQIVGDQFLAWGGADDQSNVLPEQPPLIYDLTKKQWVSNYTAPAYYQTAPPNNNTPDKPSNLGAILGGVFGCLAVIGGSVALYFYMNSRSPSTNKPTDGPAMMDLGHEERRQENRVPMQKESNIEYDLSKTSLDDQYTSPPFVQPYGQQQYGQQQYGQQPYGQQQYGQQNLRGPQEGILPRSQVILPSQGNLPGPQALYSTAWPAYIDDDNKSEVISSQTIIPNVNRQ